MANSRLHRYRLARRVPLVGLMWIPVRQGYECEIRARDVAIKMLNPNGNVVHAAHATRHAGHVKTRRRPPPWRRLPKKSCVNLVWSKPPGSVALDRETVKQLRIHESKVRGNIAAVVAPNAWAMCFTDVYRAMQKAMLLLNQLGPINIYDKGFRRLMVLWLSCKGAVVDWSRLRTAWSCYSVGVELSMLGRLVLVPARRKQVLLRAARCLRFEGLPTQRLLVARVLESCLVPPCRQLVRDAAWSSTKWQREVISWVLRKTRIVVGKPPRLRDDLSQARFAGKFCMENVQRLSPDVVAACLPGRGMHKLDVDTRTKKLLPLNAN